MAPFEFRFSALSLLLTVAATADPRIHISAIRGNVSIRHGDTGARVSGLVNAPLQTDDRIATGPNSRVDVQFDSTNTIRLGSNAEIRLLQSASGPYQTELVKGGISLSTPGVAVDTPSVSVRPANAGAYRIAINAAGESEITVRAGELEVFAPSGSQSVIAGQKMVARGSPSDPEFKIVNATSKWWRAARIFLASVQIDQVISSSSSDDKSSSKEAPKPASKTTPQTESNGNSKPTPSRGDFQPAQPTHTESATPSTHAASAPASHSEPHSSVHSAAPASTDHSNSSRSK